MGGSYKLSPDLDYFARIITDTHMKQATYTAKALAWSVHVFTASGLLAAFMAILAIENGEFRAAMLWLFLCQVIDGVDGGLARLFRVREVLPHVNGQTIDYVIDFATYAIIPAYFFYKAGFVSEEWNLPLTFVILLVSAVYYGIEGMVADDMHFVGFPVMWNMVVLFMYFIFNFPSWMNVLLVIALAVLHFVPIKFAYPSRVQRYRGLTLAITIVFLASVFLAVWLYPERSALITWSAILATAGYGALAVWETYFLRT